MSNYAKMLKQAARMQQQIADAQSNLVKITADGSSGGGAVKVTARGDGVITTIKIDPQVLTAGDASMLEDLVLSAANQALDKAREIANTEMGKATQGFNIPGLM